MHLISRKCEKGSKSTFSCHSQAKRATLIASALPKLTIHEIEEFLSPPIVDTHLRNSF